VEGRPDILAYKVYGTTSLWWVFALRNPDILKDPIRDFKAGITIKLPSPESVKSVAGG
jgi:phage tail protein X